VIFISLVYPLPSFADYNATENQISDFRIKIHRLQKGINAQRSNIKKTETQERDLLLELETLDQKITQQQHRLERYETLMSDQYISIDKKTEALNAIHSEKELVVDHLKKRIKAYYTVGTIGLFNVTFSTKSLPELLQFQEAFDTLVSYDQDVIQNYRETIKTLEKARKALALEKAVLQDFIDQALKEKNEITLTKNKKKNLLEHIRTQKKLNQQAIKEMQQASNDLSSALVTLKIQTEVQENDFLSSKGHLPPPVDGTIVTLFKQKIVNGIGITQKLPGITLKAANGEKIRAICGGTVIFSGYLRGYGNTIIIHHGYQYYTVTSRIEKLLVQQEDTVKSEDIIGIMGDTATLFDEGLYFEIRHGKKSLDPLLWLNPNRLSTAEGKASDSDL